MTLKRYTTKDFLEYAKGFDYYKDCKSTFEKYTLLDWVVFYGFTHKNEETGQELLKGNSSLLNELDEVSL